MRLLGLVAAVTLVLAACGGSDGNQSNNAAVNVAAEEGIEDVNAAVGGDELAPIPEADDDMAANQAGGRGDLNAAAPPPPAPRPPG
jgi:hypothetical protein